MTNPTDIISKARELCKAATPGPWDVRVHLVWNGCDDDSIEEPCLAVGVLDSCRQSDIALMNAAPTLLLELVEALETQCKVALLLEVQKGEYYDAFCSAQKLATVFERERDDARAEIRDIKGKS